MATSQDFVNWVCSDALDPQFLMNAFLAEGEHLLKFGKGTTHTTIYFPEVMAFNIALPPLNEQRRIVAKLDALNEKSTRAKEALEAVPPLLEKLRQSILAAAFRGDLTKDWRAKNPNVEPASKLLERIRAERRRRWEEAELEKLIAKGKLPKDDRWKEKYEEPAPVDTEGLPELPEGWCWARLEAVCLRVEDCPHRTPEYSDDGAYPALRPRDVVGGALVLSRAARVSRTEYELQIARATPIAGDVAYSRELSYGWAAVLPEDTPVCLSQGMVLMRPGAEVGAHYLSAMLNSPWGRGQAQAVAVGTAHPHINLSDLRKYAVPIAPPAEIPEILRRIEGLSAKGVKALEAAQAAAAGVSTLQVQSLTKAFQGELVPQDPADEPASALLARVREQAAMGDAAPSKARSAPKSGARTREKQRKTKAS